MSCDSFEFQRPDKFREAARLCRWGGSRAEVRGSGGSRAKPKSGTFFLLALDPPTSILDTTHHEPSAMAIDTAPDRHSRIAHAGFTVWISVGVDSRYSIHHWPYHFWSPNSPRLLRGLVDRRGLGTFSDASQVGLCRLCDRVVVAVERRHPPFPCAVADNRQSAI